MRLRRGSNSTHSKDARQPSRGLRQSSGASAQILACCVVLSLMLPSVTSRVRPENRSAGAVAQENARRGDANWARGAWSQASVEGYASLLSVSPGGQLSFHVSMRPLGRYRVEIERLGWYAGQGGPLLACIPTCKGDQGGSQHGVPKPATATGFLERRWPVTARFKVPRGWVSGYYLARLVRTDGTQAGESGRVPFIVRPPAWARPRILVVVPVNTWEAYNAWGGKNLYYNSSSGHHPATHVSFNRPFLGRGVIFLYEYQLVRFLERQGYDVGYVTDLDVDRDPSLLRRARMVIVAGHGEYWSATERLALEAAANHGVNVIFTGANNGYWLMRYERGRHVMVAYKRLHDPTHDPRLWTKKFRHLMPPHPECRLL